MKSKSKLILNILTIIGIVAVIFFIYFAVKERWFLDNEILLTKIKSFGLLAPLCFILIQIVQVVLPVIPGGASCLVGVMAFGAVGGFIYNYVGLVLGSICSFLLSRKFGMSIINKLFKETYQETPSAYRKKKKETVDNQESMLENYILQ